MKNILLNLRVPPDFIVLLKEISKKHDCSVSELVRFSIKELLDRTYEFDLPNELKLSIIKKEQKSTNAQLYLVKNMYKRILDMAMSSYFITRGINMQSINIALDIYVRVFDLYDDKIKKAIGTDFRMTVKRLRDQNFLLDQSQTIKKLKMIEGR